MCQNLRAIKPLIADRYAGCCHLPAESRTACLQTINTDIGDAFNLILAAKIACDEGNNDLMREHLRRLRDILLPKIVSGANGQIYNTMVAMGRNDWITLDTTLTLAPQDPCKNVTMTIVPQGIVNAEAAGKAVEDQGGETGVTVVVPAASTQAFTTCTYNVPSGTTFDMRFGEEFRGVMLGGSFDLARTNTPIPENGLVVAAIPTDLQFTASKYGHKLRLSLDKTNPYNALRLDAQGKGVLGVALTLESDSSALVGLVYVGSTIYFEFPVEVNASWTSVRLMVPRTRPGNDFTPVNDLALIAADGPRTSPPPIANDPCSDLDGNGIRDGADERIYALMYSLECDSH